MKCLPTYTQYSTHLYELHTKYNTHLYKLHTVGRGIFAYICFRGKNIRMFNFCHVAKKFMRVKRIEKFSHNLIFPANATGEKKINGENFLIYGSCIYT
jgi:hypothetical protein